MTKILHTHRISPDATNASPSARNAFCNALPPFCNGVLSANVFANTAGGIIEPIFNAGGIEALSTAANAEEGWYRLAGYRDYPHHLGLQRVDRAAANAIAKDFSSAVERVKRFFGRHRPAIYNGHPDDGTYPTHDDTTVYGNVDAIDARDDGLYAHIAWANEWDALKADHKWRLSPRWVMRRLDAAGRVLSPIRLVSIGLTETPNLPDAAFANEQITKQMNELLKMILAKLGFAPERIDTTISGGENAVTAEEVEAALSKQAAAKTPEAEKAKTDLASANAKIATLETEKAAALATAANERKARATMAVDDAIAEGRIPPAERSGWEKKLSDAEDWATIANELMSAEPKVHTTRQFGDQGARRNTPGVITAANEFRTLVDEHMAKTNCNFDRAWSNVSGTEKGKALLKRMEAPAE